MNNSEVFNYINNAMSLRAPQAEALKILSEVANVITFSKTSDNGDMLTAINTLGYSIKDFDRNFPSLCFSIATGVGKTRLMGAFITYLYITKNIKNFFIVAPNLTIYNKLITDFTPNTAKYVFMGIAEFAQNRPLIVTGDDYQNMGGLTSYLYDNHIKINIFNISKINREGEGRTKFRSFRETLGSSYFNYLQSLPDLVLLMDEAHRYRATAGMKIINELNAVLGLELTATAHDESGRQFANIVYNYALSQAVKDKYVKKPTIIGRTNFDKTVYNDEKLEEIKLIDGFKVHEDVKAELEVYASQRNIHRVKPFLLIVARDTVHANALKDKIDANEKYKGKVIVVHSNQKGAELDENVKLLLEVEKPDNPIEIVIHVNMLSEGWDVNNLYTIVPLRKADSKTLVEQSIGRGLRLPYGKHTGIDGLDRLNIVAHDKFAEIIKIAEEQGFQFQKIALADNDDVGNKVAVENTSSILAEILGDATDQRIGGTQTLFDLPKPNIIANPIDTPLNLSKEEIPLAGMILEKMEEKAKYVESLAEVKSDRRILEITEEIARKNSEEQLQLEDNNFKDKIRRLTKTLATRFVERQIKIPPIRIVRAMPKTGVEYQEFKLDLTPFNWLKPTQQNILAHDILENKRYEEGEAIFTKQYEYPQDYIIAKLMTHLPCASEKDMELLNFFAVQVVKHIERSAVDSDVEKILFFNSDKIADEIVLQADKHKSVPKIETKTDGFENEYIFLRNRPTKLLGNKEEGEQSFRERPRNLSKIKGIIFTGFTKCFSIKTKFDSDTERQLAVLLEDTQNVLKWERLSNEQARDTFKLLYNKEGEGLAAYCPDFVVETTDMKYIVETKSADNMTDNDVKAKQKIAMQWCAEATKYEVKRYGKVWTYLLIPHNELDPTRTFEKLTTDWKVKKGK
ncbi:MAG: DEAD/DEAH box helicase family protein [Rickettsiales bacterium]|jgi:type III restriction enzyme|nr:DEAD/DEAH box helicase family protein [Rickettsiales bacterium]